MQLSIFHCYNNDGISWYNLSKGCFEASPRETGRAVQVAYFIKIITMHSITLGKHQCICSAKTIFFGEFNNVLYLNSCWMNKCRYWTVVNKILLSLSCIFWYWPVQWQVIIKFCGGVWIHSSFLSPTLLNLLFTLL